jgi:hypothetical protein
MRLLFKKPNNNNMSNTPFPKDDDKDHNPEIEQGIQDKLDAEKEVFVTKLKEEMIPSICYMIELENKHLAWLHKQKQSPLVWSFERKAKNNIAHLEQRLAEYELYVKENS